MEPTDAVPTATEVAAQQKFACPACGAEAQWNAAKGALVCPFCGTTSPFELPVATAAAIVENDLATALANVQAQSSGWATEKVSVKCQSCQAISVFDPAHAAKRCEFCGSSAIIPYDQIKAPIRPESLLEFKVPETQVREQIRDWYGSRFWAPNALKSRALTDTVHGVYLPYWTFDAQVHADWTADAGYHYYETETYRDSNGDERTRQVQHTRWVPAAGSIDHFFDDELVPASVGVQADLLRSVEPFPTTTDLKPYDPAFLMGWTVEQYQIDLIAAANASRQAMESKVYSLCSSEVPGDTQRGLSVDSDYAGQTFKHILMPIWLLTYTYGPKSFQVVVNGYTGEIAGKYPLSWVKITLAVIAALIVLAIVIAVSGNR